MSSDSSVCRKVERCRYYRPVAVVQSPLVGIGTPVVAYGRAHEPEIIASVGTCAAFEFLFPSGVGLAAYFNAFYRPGRGN